MATPPGDVTHLLLAWNQGNPAALDELLPLVYDELRKLARSHLRRERANHTLQPTALVNEVYLRLIRADQISWQSRAHFFGIAAQAMRRILLNHAEAQHAEKRGGPGQNLALEEAGDIAQAKGMDVMALDDALKSLEAFDLRQARVVELRYFAGLSIEETAEVLGISPATVKREWTTAKLWLQREISRAEKC